MAVLHPHGCAQWVWAWHGAGLRSSAEIKLLPRREDFCSPDFSSASNQLSVRQEGTDHQRNVLRLGASGSKYWLIVWNFCSEAGRQWGKSWLLLGEWCFKVNPAEGEGRPEKQEQSGGYWGMQACAKMVLNSRGGLEGAWRGSGPKWHNKRSQQSVWEEGRVTDIWKFCMTKPGGGSLTSIIQLWGLAKTELSDEY